MGNNATPTSKLAILAALAAGLGSAAASAPFFPAGLRENLTAAADFASGAVGVLEEQRADHDELRSGVDVWMRQQDQTVAALTESVKAQRRNNDDVSVRVVELRTEVGLKLKQQDQTIAVLTERLAASERDFAALLEKLAEIEQRLPAA